MYKIGELKNVQCQGPTPIVHMSVILLRFSLVQLSSAVCAIEISAHTNDVRQTAKNNNTIRFIFDTSRTIMSDVG